MHARTRLRYAARVRARVITHAHGKPDTPHTRASTRATHAPNWMPGMVRPLPIATPLMLMGSPSPSSLARYTRLATAGA